MDRAPQILIALTALEQYCFPADLVVHLFLSCFRLLPLITSPGHHHSSKRSLDGEVYLDRVTIEAPYSSTSSCPSLCHKVSRGGAHNFWIQLRRCPHPPDNEKEVLTVAQKRNLQLFSSAFPLTSVTDISLKYSFFVTPSPHCTLQHW